MEQRILEIAASVFKREVTELDLNAPRAEVRGWDSFAHIALVTVLEDKLDLVVPIEDVPDITRLADFLKYVDA